MRNLLLILILLSPSAWGAIEVVAHRCDVGGFSGGTTTAVNTTDATNMAVIIGRFGGGTPAITADTGNNSWTARNLQTRIIFYDAGGITTNASHTVTYTGQFSSACVIAWKAGATSSYFDVELGGSATAATSIQLGSLTPGENNEIGITGLCYVLNPNAPTIDWTASGGPDNVDVGGSNVGLSMSWQIQTTATARNPTWSWTTADSVSMDLEFYKAAAAAGGATPQMMMLGVGP